MKLRCRILLLSLTLLFVLPLSGQETRVRFHTNKGKFTVKLYNETPIHRDNFIKLVKEGAYNNALFHRVIKGFMCQAAGDMRSNSDEEKSAYRNKYDYTIEAEILYPLYFHKRGALAAARKGNEQNPEKRSDGIQFYIVTGEYFLESDLQRWETPDRGTMPSNVKEAYKTQGGAPHLDTEYTVFGEIVEGMKTIEKIEESKTDDNDRPVKDIFIRSAEIIE